MFHRSIEAEVGSSVDSESVTYCFSKAELGVAKFNKNVDDKET
jgi:hypothetical protein